MNDGMISRQATLNAGAIPASAEELSQRYSNLFQQHSRLKAKHAVLKKAVIKEQASNVSLQGNVKEKEKELRKLQEQLDLLAFHNERLTKRIQAVQDSDQKGNHFSLLGGSVKKELEKSAQALDEANMDLERKIQENEKLHDELADRQFEFTDNINKLLKQIQDLDKQVQDLQEENASLQSVYKDSAVNTVVKEVKIVDQEEQARLLKEIDTLKSELNEKNKLLEQHDQQSQKNDTQLLTEIQSLRAILLAKVGNLKREDTSLYEIVPASNALKELEDQVKQYIQVLGEKSDLKDVPSEIAEKLAISTETYSKELLNVFKQLEEAKTELNKLTVEKDEQSLLEKKKTQEQQSQFEQKIQEQKEKITSLTATIEANKNDHAKAMAELQTINANLEKDNIALQQQLEEQKSNAEKGLQTVNANFEKDNLALQQQLEEQKSNAENALQELKDFKKAFASKSGQDKEIQVELIDSKTVEDDEEEDDDVFVYPKATNEDNQVSIPEPVKEELEEEDDDEEVFVYRGMDAVTPATEPITADTISDETNTKQYDENDLQQREDKLKSYYEHQINNLTEKIQMTDSKAFRFAQMYKSLKDKILEEDKEKDIQTQKLLAEIERLNKDVVRAQDLLTTTETNYRQQVDTMTEFISQLQEKAEQEHQSPPSRRSHNYSNQR